jgi:uncharacterized membrane protein YeaQ/YmgE (transglycosylase-associated protein family)
MMFDFSTWLYLIVVGIIVGYVARLLVPGDDPMKWWQTMLLGIVGSLVGGFLGYALFGFDEDEGFLQPGGIIFSLIGAVVALLIWRVIKSRRGGTRAA